MKGHLADYFLPEQEYFLENISYMRNMKNSESQDFTLGWVDDIVAERTTNGMKVIFSRTIKIEPEGIFDLTVAFGTYLKCKPDVTPDINWDAGEIEQELKENGAFVLANLVPRTSLLIAEITSSFGQPPVILPPVPDFPE